MSYGTSFPDLFRRAATYVDKILKEANPADLPVEQPTKLKLVFNLKTAKDLGLVIPREFLSNERRDVCSCAGFRTCRRSRYMSAIGG
jgi:ABC-type uncharacterized transport system substrate-binding protein